MTIFGIFLIIIGITGFILGVVLEVYADNDKPYIFLSYLVFLIPFGIAGIDNENPKPTKQDVIDGKAIYQKTQVITGNDTIKTYEIVWKQEN